MLGIQVDVPYLLIHLRDDENFLRCLDEIDRLCGIEQKRGRTHRPAAYLPCVAGSAGEDAFVVFLERLARPRLQDRIIEIRDAKSGCLASAGRLPWMDRVLRHMMGSARRQLVVWTLRNPAGFSRGKVWDGFRRCTTADHQRDSACYDL